MRYIFEIRVKPEHAVEEYVAAWERGSRIIQALPGARGTRLLRRLGDARTLLAIAEWDSKESRDRAMAELEGTDPETRQTLDEHLALAEFSFIGEYDETEWVVLPERTGESPTLRSS